LGGPEVNRRPPLRYSLCSGGITLELSTGDAPAVVALDTWFCYKD
jgi:hypothetical protein